MSRFNWNRTWKCLRNIQKRDTVTLVSNIPTGREPHFKLSAEWSKKDYFHVKFNWPAYYVAAFSGVNPSWRLRKWGSGGRAAGGKNMHAGDDSKRSIVFIAVKTQLRTGTRNRPILTSKCVAAFVMRSMQLTYYSIVIFVVFGSSTKCLLCTLHSVHRPSRYWWKQHPAKSHVRYADFIFNKI